MRYTFEYKVSTIHMAALEIPDGVTDRWQYAMDHRDAWEDEVPVEGTMDVDVFEDGFEAVEKTDEEEDNDTP